jgi:hypothetical protein
MICYSCNKTKNKLNPVASTLLVGTNLLMCQMCIDSKFEPRWVIILAGRTLGPEKVRDFILKRRYVGKEIFANELIV